jgi:hypothetical protein
MHTGWVGLGIAAQNVGGKMKFGDSRYGFPTNYGVGASVAHPRYGVRLAADLNFPSAYHSDFRTGVEWMYKDVLALRTGYRQEMGSVSDPLSGPTFGVGAGRGGLWMDYGYLLAGSGPGQHRLGLRLDLSHMGANDEQLGETEKPKGVAKPKDFERAKDDSFIGPPVPKSKKQ